MTNNDSFFTLSLDNLNTVTGGYHDADPPAPSAPTPPVTGGAVVGGAIGDIIRRLSVCSAPAK